MVNTKIFFLLCNLCVNGEGRGILSLYGYYVLISISNGQNWFKDANHTYEHIKVYVDFELCVTCITIWTSV